MAAKRTAPKSARAKKPTTRPAARKADTRRPAERTRASAPPRKSVPVSTASKKAPTSRSSPAAAAEAAAKSKITDISVTPVRPAAPPSPPPLPVRMSSFANQEVDDGDVEPGSLLAGPRNVTPYIAKRGEQYMSKEQLEHFRQILLGWKRDLMEEVDRTVSHMKDEAANFPDPNDRATQEEEFSLELRTRDRERKLIRKIDEALKRTEDGSYGYCLETGEEIGVKRLEARPVATLTIEAQERRERRERQYGDRDDRYR